MSFSIYSARNRHQNENKIPTKIIIRRLPPNFTLDIFKEQVSPLPEYNYIYFVKADRTDRIQSFSRIYINFVYPQDVFSFKEKFDNYVFLGPRGLEYPAVVEFAPFQKIPKERFSYNRDPKCGTIKNNEYYLRFVESIKLPKYDCLERPEYNLQLNSHLNERESITPLLKYISAKKSDQIKSHLERKRETKPIRSDNCMVFVNSSVKKSGHHWTHSKKYSV